LDKFFLAETTNELIRELLAWLSNQNHHIELLRWTGWVNCV